MRRKRKDDLVLLKEYKAKNLSQNKQSRKAELERFAEIGRAHAYLMHEIRRPLVTIGLLARSIHMRGKLDEEDSETIEKIIEMVKRSETELRDFMQLVEPSKGKREVVSVGSLLKSVYRALKPRAKDADVKLELRCDGDDEILVSCMQRNLRRAILNVAQNSVEAMAETGGSLALGCDMADSEAIIKVEDTGPGMDLEVVEKIFQPFFSTKKDGTGLGLSLARKIIQDHDGRMTVRSKPGKGTIVTIHLSIYEGEDKQG